MKRYVYEYAKATDNKQVYDHFNAYHKEDHSLDDCSREWVCEWDECGFSQLNDNSDTCWEELCSNECG